MNRTFSLAIAIIAVITISGCGNNLPELKQTYSQINFTRNPDSNIISNELLVLVNAEDEDGEDDIDSLHVINEDHQLFWSVNSSNWSNRSSRGMEWLGYERLLTADGSLPEPGEYRVLLADRAGERVENNIFIPLIKDLPKEEDFPQLIFTEDIEYLEVKSPESRNIISFYDSAGKLIGAFTATPGHVNINKLNDGASILENFRSAEISYYSNIFGAGLVSGPFNRK